MQTTTFDQADKEKAYEAFELLLEDLEDRTELVRRTMQAAVDADDMDAISSLANLRKQIRTVQDGLGQLQEDWRRVFEATRNIATTEGDPPFAPPLPPLKPVPPESGSPRGPKTITNQPKGHYSYVLDGHQHASKHAIRLVIRLLKELHASDPTFLDRYARHVDHGDKRKLIAKTPDSLYFSSPHLAETHAEQLVPGWWIGKNYSVKELARRLQIAQEVTSRPFTFDLGQEVGDSGSN